MNNSNSLSPKFKSGDVIRRISDFKRGNWHMLKIHSSNGNSYGITVLDPGRSGTEIGRKTTILVGNFEEHWVLDEAYLVTKVLEKYGE
jgi:hypothetical protein